VDQSEENLVQMQSDINILSIFPHHQKPGVVGALLGVLSREAVRPLGFASSPSALSFLISASDTAKIIDGLFATFEFPAYPTPFDWHAAYYGQEQVFREIIGSYEEKVIKVYGITQQPDLDLWKMTLPFSLLGDLGSALTALDRLGCRLPFIMGDFNQEEELFFAFCFAGNQGEQVRQELARHLPLADPLRHDWAVALSLQGPHFGDRYGIISALVSSLSDAGVRPLAVSCTVHSISVIIAAGNLESSLVALRSQFQIPH
jgi:aspartokinase